MREIIVRIVEGTGNGEPSSDAKLEEEEKEKNSSKNSVKKVAAAYVTEQALSLLLNEAQYFFGKWENLNEDYVGQNNMQNTMRILNSVAGLATSTIAGGMVAGPLGMVVGATVGLMKNIINTQHTMREYRENVYQQIYSNYFFGTRVGFVNGGRGTEN